MTFCVGEGSGVIDLIICFSKFSSSCCYSWSDFIGIISFSRTIFSLGSEISKGASGVVASASFKSTSIVIFNFSIYFAPLLSERPINIE